MLVADYQLITNIPMIRDGGGATLTDPAFIMQEFVRLFSTLYSPIPHYDVADLDSLLGGSSAPKVDAGRQ